MIHPLLQRQENLVIERHYDSEDYIFGIEFSPVKGIFQPELKGNKIDLLLSLPIQYFQSIANSYHLQKTQYLFDSYPCYIALYNSICLFSGSHIPVEHSNCLVNKMYDVFQFKKVITIDTVEYIGQLSQLVTSSVQNIPEFKELVTPYSLPKSTSAFFTFSEFKNIPCISLISQEDDKQVLQVLNFIKSATELTNITLPSPSYSFSTLYA